MPKKITKKTEEVKAPKKEVKGTKAVVNYRGLVREYSLEIHGENFETLAKSFASQFADAKVTIA